MTGGRLCSDAAYCGVQSTCSAAALYLGAAADCKVFDKPALTRRWKLRLSRNSTAPVNVNPFEPLAAFAEAGAFRISFVAACHNGMMGELTRASRGRAVAVRRCGRPIPLGREDLGRVDVGGLVGPARHRLLHDSISDDRDQDAESEDRGYHESAVANGLHEREAFCDRYPSFGVNEQSRDEPDPNAHECHDCPIRLAADVAGVSRVGEQANVDAPLVAFHCRCDPVDTFGKTAQDRPELEDVVAEGLFHCGGAEHLGSDAGGQRLRFFDQNEVRVDRAESAFQGDQRPECAGELRVEGEPEGGEQTQQVAEQVGRRERAGTEALGEETGEGALESIEVDRPCRWGELY